MQRSKRNSIIRPNIKKQRYMKFTQKDENLIKAWNEHQKVKELKNEYKELEKESNRGIITRT